LYELGQVYNWEQSGAVTPEEAAEIWMTAYDTKRRVQIVNVGEILIDAGTGALGDDRLLCDGSQHNIADYPDLFDAIGYTYGGSGAVFNVPDLRGRVPVGAGAGPGLTSRASGDQGGAETHQLSIGEMPAHTHSTTPETTAIAQLGAGEPVHIPGLTAGSTGSTGGDGAHNNMQPFTALRFVIVTGRW
jgi:microcystin-dependent protein